MSILNTIFVRSHTELSHKMTPLVSVGSDTLLVTIGDSWTFGGSMKFLLPESCTSQDLAAFRKNNVFGAHLAKKLNADWINVAFPAVSNQWIARQFSILSKIRCQLEYKKIYVVITLTEIGREVGDDYLDLNKFTSVDMLIKSLSRSVLDQITNNIPKDTTVILGRNYVDDSYHSKLMLSKSWLDLIREAGNDFDSFNTPSFMLIDPINKIHENFSKFNIPRETFLIEMDGVVNSAKERIDALTRSNFNIHKQGYQHPNVEGHKLWADYIFKEMVCL